MEPDHIDTCDQEQWIHERIQAMEQAGYEVVQFGPDEYEWMPTQQTQERWECEQRVDRANQPVDLPTDEEINAMANAAGLDEVPF